jgi:hypothetical protein
MPDPLVTVTAYPAGDDARLAKGALDSAGIDNLIDDAQERRVKVRVQHVDAIRAGDVLTARVPTLVEIDEPDEETAPPLCPACGSAEIGSSHRGRTFLLIAMMALTIGVGTGLTDVAFVVMSLAAVVLLITGRRRCIECTETWD